MVRPALSPVLLFGCLLTACGGNPSSAPGDPSGAKAPAEAADKPPATVESPPTPTPDPPPSVEPGEVAAAEPVPVVLPVGGLPGPFEAETYETLQGCCGTLWNASASSHLEAQGDNRYTIDQLSDDNPFTAWVEGQDDGGVGAWVEFDLRCEAADSRPLSITVANGYQKNAKAFRANGRVAAMELSVPGGEGTARKVIAVLRLEDRVGTQDLALDLPTGVRGRLTLTEIYPGARWPDTAISELFVNCSM